MSRHLQLLPLVANLVANFVEARKSRLPYRFLVHRSPLTAPCPGQSVRRCVHSHQHRLDAVFRRRFQQPLKCDDFQPCRKLRSRSICDLQKSLMVHMGESSVAFGNVEHHAGCGFIDPPIRSAREPVHEVSQGKFFDHFQRKLIGVESLVMKSSILFRSLPQSLEQRTSAMTSEGRPAS